MLVQDLVHGYEPSEMCNDDCHPAHNRHCAVCGENDHSLTKGRAVKPTPNWTGKKTE